MIQRQKKRKKKRGTKDRTIIITPLTLIDQWKKEINRIAPNQLKIVDFYKNKKFDKKDFESCDIVLSTIDTFAKRVLKTGKHWDDYEGEYYYSYNTRYHKSPNQFAAGFFSRIIMDECHDIANGERARKLALFCEIKGIKNRWAITGTPIKDDIVRNLAGISSFIGIRYKEFEEALRGASWYPIWLNSRNKEDINAIKEFLTPIMLRRIKTHARIISSWPKKYTDVTSIELTERERFLYDRIEADGKSTTEFCVHPSLVIKEADIERVDKDINAFTARFVLHGVSQWLIHQLNRARSIVKLRCLTCRNKVGITGRLLSKCGHLFCDECVNEARFSQDATMKFCPSCGLNFTRRPILVQDIYQSRLIHREHHHEYQQIKRRKKLDIMHLLKKYSKSTISNPKIDAIIEKIGQILADYKGDKILVFSKYSDVFDIIATRLEIEKIPYLRYVDLVGRKERERILQSFKNKRKCNVLLISMKTASDGLNLQQANHIVMVDPPINAATDLQAVGRSWRLGQNKDVVVYRFITIGTIEQKIWNESYAKKNLASEDQCDRDLL